MILPTVARMLHYYPDAETYKAGAAPLAAILCAVETPSLVTLSVFTKEGNLRPERLVPLVQEGEALPEIGHFARWMPFQVGQARAALAA